MIGIGTVVHENNNTLGTAIKRDGKGYLDAVRVGVVGNRYDVVHVTEGGEAMGRFQEGIIHLVFRVRLNCLVLRQGNVLTEVSMTRKEVWTCRANAQGISVIIGTTSV